MKFLPATIEFSAEEVEALYALQHRDNSYVLNRVQDRKATFALADAAIERVLTPSKERDTRLRKLREQLHQATIARDWNRCRMLDEALQALGDFPPKAPEPGE